MGVVWRPGAGSTRLRASVGRASKLPSFFALASPPALGGNPALRARARVGRRGGSRAPLRPGRASTSAPPTSGRSTATSSTSTSTASCTSTAPTSARQGVELTARWQPHATVWLDAEATWLDVQDLETAATLLHTPKWTGGGRLTWQPSPALSLRVQARATAGYLDVQYPVPDRDSVDGYGLARRGRLLARRPRPVGPRPRRQPHRHVATRPRSASPAPAARSGPASAGTGSGSRRARRLRARARRGVRPGGVDQAVCAPAVEEIDHRVRPNRGPRQR